MLGSKRVLERERVVMSGSKKEKLGFSRTLLRRPWRVIVLLGELR